MSIILGWTRGGKRTEDQGRTKKPRPRFKNAIPGTNANLNIYLNIHDVQSAGPCEPQLNQQIVQF